MKRFIDSAHRHIVLIGIACSGVFIFLSLLNNTTPLVEKCMTTLALLCLIIPGLKLTLSGMSDILSPKKMWSGVMQTVCGVVALGAAVVITLQVFSAGLL